MGNVTPGTEELNTGPRRLRVGLICDALGGPELAAAIRRLPEVELAAIAGERLEAAVDASAPRFDDPRGLIVQSGVEVVVIATATRTAVELAEIAADAGVHVWRTSPLGRSFAEAVQVVSRRRNRTTLYRVASWWDHASEHVFATASSLGRHTPTISSVEVRTPAPPTRHWSRKRAEAGGGVVLARAYDALYALLALRGLPACVWATSVGDGAAPTDPTQRIEHACCAALAFPDGSLGSIRAAWDLTPPTCRLELAGPDGRLEVTPSEVHAWSPSGVAVGGAGLQADYLATDLARFFADVRGGRVHPPESLDLHLETCALIEAVYLSAVTGQPEFPRKQYEVQQWPAPAR